VIGDGPLVQVAQRAVDLERASAFYAHLLEVPVAATFDPPGLAFLLLGDTRLLLERGAPSALLYFAVDATLGPSGTEERMAFLTDSEGNTVALVEHRPREARAGA